MHRTVFAGILPAWYEGIEKNSKGELKLNSMSDVVTVLGNIIEIGLVFSGILAGIFLILGGIFYIASLDDPSRKAKAKETIFYAVAGLVISMSAYGIVRFITGVF